MHMTTWAAHGELGCGVCAERMARLAARRGAGGLAAAGEAGASRGVGSMGWTAAINPAQCRLCARGSVTAQSLVPSHSGKASQQVPDAHAGCLHPEPQLCQLPPLLLLLLLPPAGHHSGATNPNLRKASNGVNEPA